MDLKYNRKANEEALTKLGRSVDVFLSQETAKYKSFCLPRLNGIEDLANLVLQFIGLPIANPIANPREAWIYSNEATGWDIDEQQALVAHLAINSGRFYNAIKYHWPAQLLREPTQTLLMLESDEIFGRKLQCAIVRKIDGELPDTDTRWIRCEEVPYTRRQLNQALGLLEEDSDKFGPEKRINDILFGANLRLTNDAYHSAHYKIGGWFPTKADGEVRHLEPSVCEECVKSSTKGQKFILCLMKTRSFHAIEWCAEHPDAACTIVPIETYW